eukprot:451372-Alexandrium_andersonii.AAC.1
MRACLQFVGLACACACACAPVSASASALALVCVRLCMSARARIHAYAGVYLCAGAPVHMSACACLPTFCPRAAAAADAALRQRG